MVGFTENTCCGLPTESTSRDWPLGFKPKTSSSTLLAVVEAGGLSTWAGAPFGGICTRPSVRNLAKWGERTSKHCRSAKRRIAGQ
ncbi:uncharacterized protein LACBIDRAFT_294650 [Laccaria bicolor S238N-H82]|uniref:Predicted protein n=1 Tax=Laccaria bicolor (strain S238N-H82 / ATCC MYA-4686) TaxID=486041 RepID=B0DFZ5_LACBS|nr:uncharacterized protein LACBIDRAFT_294650 [Laccaria bicolor S238N-H82]EDR06550.1 predicted protein [Laccaria bicolor S238N-H82]|eukprot:XP_001882922.1 predicted protein [Laccaria bicolor S238N-H82]